MRLRVSHCLPLVALALLVGCGSGGAERVRSVTLPETNGPQSDYPVVIGEAFTIDGVTHTPLDRLNYDAVGLAAIGEAGGEGITAAHKTLPLPSYAEVTSLETGKTILVRIERRGPMVNDRLLELSPGAAAQLGLAVTPAVAVRVRRVNPPEPERALLRAGERAPDRMDTPKPLLAVLKRRLDVQAPDVASLPVGASSASPAAAMPPEPLRPEPAATAHPVAPGSLQVQVAAFSTRERAERAAGQIGGEVSPAGKLWRVRIGPLASPQDAEAALAKARDAGYSDARILRER